MNPVLSFVLTALGVAGFAAAAFTAKQATGYYTYGSELVLYGALIAAGVGLYRGRPFGKVLALAWLRAGSWAFFVVPIGIILWFATLQGSSGNFLQAVGQLFFVVAFLATDKSAVATLIYVGGALLALGMLSYVCARLYRRLAGPQPALSGGERRTVTAVAATFIAIAFAAQHRIGFSDFQLPTALRSPETQAMTQRWAQEELEKLVGMPLLVDGGKGLVYLLPDSRIAVYVDVATAQPTKQSLPQYVLNDPIQSPQLREARFSRDGTLFWSNWTNEIVDLRTARIVKAGVEQKLDQYLAIGFVDGQKRLLLYDTVNARVIAIDTATGLLAYKADVAPPGGFSTDLLRKEFAERVASRGVFTPDRKRLVWFYLDTLYMMDVANGALDSMPFRTRRDAPLLASRDSSHVFAAAAYEKQTAALADVAARTSVATNIQAIEALHLSAAQGLIVSLVRDSGGARETTIARFNLADLATPAWKATFQERWLVRVSADGKHLYAYDPTLHRLETAELGELKGEVRLELKPLPVELPPGRVNWISYFAEGGGILVTVQSPKVAIVRLDASGGVAGSRVVDFTAFAPK